MTSLDPARPASADDDSILSSLGFETPAAVVRSQSFIDAPPPRAVDAAPVDSFASLVAGVAPTSTLQAAQAAAVAPIAMHEAPVHAAGTRREQRERERSGSTVAPAPVAARREAAAPPRRPVDSRSTRSSRTERSTSRARTVGTRLLSLGAMIFAGALAVGMSVPASAFGPSASDSASATQTQDQSLTAKAPSQTVEVASDVSAASTARDAYTVTSWAEMLTLKYGTRDFTYTPTTGRIRWPFPYSVPISSGFGERAAPCQACSSIHMGLDFVPGEGAPIYAIADGVVALHDDEAGGFGNHVIIDHGDVLGNGQDIQTLYGHMQHGTSALVVGDVIHAGDLIGLVGRTGVATGNHLHFEVHVNGAQVDPFAWEKANATNNP
ncbi:hypothetical protein BH11ACT3_BH11ACT3_05730 [soil metagenome]